MPTSPQYLFVYGSLRSDSGHPAHGYVRAYFTLLGPAHVSGKVYDLGEYPGAVPADDGQVVGELYRLQDGADFNVAAAVLDEYEGLFETPPLFRRRPVQVNTGGSGTEAWIYWYNGPVEGMQPIASGDALQGMAGKIRYKSNP